MPLSAENTGDRFKMNRVRMDGIYLLLIGSAMLIVLDAAIGSVSPDPMIDFLGGVYNPAKCLIQHCDPYNEGELLRFYQANGIEYQQLTAMDRINVIRFVYPPTGFSFAAPFALLPRGPASMLWMLLMVGGLIFASFLAWNLGADSAPVLAGGLIGILLANSELLIVIGNPSGVVIGLCVVAVWCFLKERFVSVGILFLAICLAVKPQAVGLIWLYFFLAGGVYRKRAMQTLLVLVAIGLPSVLWVWHVSPHWMSELHSNVQAFAGHGGFADPGPASTSSHGAGRMINLQTVISVFRDDPRIYNQVSYLICAPLLLLWVFVTLRSRFSQQKAWLALAAIAALSMLPVYHRQYDAKLLLLTVPACAMLWAEGGLIGRIALYVNIAGFVLSGDIWWLLLSAFVNSLHLHATMLTVKILTVLEVFPVPLSLLVMGIFYLWVYASRSSGSVVKAESVSQGESPLAPAQPGFRLDLKRPLNRLFPRLPDILDRKIELS
jgi:hypothetical protein